MDYKKFKLQKRDLTFFFDNKILPCDSTDQVCLCQDIIGQERAVEAIKVGLGLKSVGYNIFITGLSGTGRMTTVKTFLEDIDSHLGAPDDLCYVYNFKSPDNPSLIRLPASKGNLFKKKMNEFIDDFLAKFPDILESKELLDKYEDIKAKYEKVINKYYQKMEEAVAKKNFTIEEFEIAPNTKGSRFVPLVAGMPRDIEELEQLAMEGQFDKKELNKIKKNYRYLMGKLNEIKKKVKKVEKEQNNEFKKALKDVVKPILEEEIRDILKDLNHEKVREYLKNVKEDILKNLEQFKLLVDGGDKSNPLLPIFGSFLKGKPDRSFLIKYDVNVIVDNSPVKKPPVIIERFPNYKNLFGTIERKVNKSGIITTDFTRIKAGSFLKANGGYLILNAMDVLIEPEVWKTLKRALKYRKFSIQSFDPIFAFNTSFLNPEPIDIDIKVLLIGDYNLYYLLYALDEEFKKIFKIHADFDTQMDAERKNIEAFVSLLNKIITEEKLLHLNRSGIEEVLRYGMRLAGRRNKITTRFSDIADLLRESTYWAKRDGKDIVDGEIVKKAVDAKNRRNGKFRDKIHELIEESIILIDTDSEKVGQINGLSVYDFDFFSFGIPTKITAQVSLGKDGVINIERESGMSGKVHDKGMFILSSFLRSRFNRDFPLSVNVSICFEQSYSGVDGDSASSTEIYAILSALSEVPIKQYIAVTGSVNQKGEIQPIGGVNEKIEGFFEVCKRRGLTGKEGVIIPIQNVPDLVLNEEVINAVESGKFNIYAISHVDEGIEILTGKKAGKRRKDGTFPRGSINFLVEKKLKEFAEKLKSFENE